MATRPIKQPRRIDPSLVEIGDDIAVEHPEKRGIVTINRGIVASRMESGSTRYYLTKDGATLMAWDAKGINKIKVILYGRDEVPQTTLFELPGEVEKRIA